MLQAVYNVICYDDRTRLRTAAELLRATDEIESQVERVRQVVSWQKEFINRSNF